MYLLNLSYALNETYVIADTAIDQSIDLALSRVKGINVQETKSKLNKEGSNVLITIEFKPKDINDSIRDIFDNIKSEIIDQMKQLIGKQPENIEMIVGNDE